MTMWHFHVDRDGVINQYTGGEWKRTNLSFGIEAPHPYPWRDKLKFTSIWDLSYPMDFVERLRRTRELSAQKLAAALPRRIRYWVTLQEIGRATMKSPDVPASSVDYVLDHLTCKPNTRDY